MYYPNQFNRNYYFQPNGMVQNMGGYHAPVHPHFTGQIPNQAIQHSPSPYPHYPTSIGGYYYQQPLPETIIPPAYYGKNKPKSIFDNPLEPIDNYYKSIQMMQQQLNQNPYPRPNMIAKPNGGFGSILNSFKGQDGNIDLNKMMNTAGQMVNAVSQVSAMVKGLGGMFKV
jgi:hypothetical protein